VALTFDDGYRSVVTEALPLLSARGVPATVYVITDRIGQDNRWPGQPPSIPRLPLADAGELQELLAAGVTLGAHSASHRALPSLGASAVRKEIVVAADDLEQRVQRPVRHFAYPYGLFGERERAMAAARFDTAVTAECRGVDDASAPHALPRIDADDVRGAARLGLLGRAGLAQYLSVRRVLRRALR
jgi:peptidoglycan/xylan/chitin deacetylase (PgdA/CDA1 family)